MSRKYKFHDKQAVYFVTFAVIDWVDVFTRNDYRQIIANSMQFCVNNKSLVIHGWVIMSNHVHLLISLEDSATNTLSDILRDMKKFTATHLIKAIRENTKESRREWMLSKFGIAGKLNSNNKNFQLWQQNNHPVQIIDEEHCRNVLTYIHGNPVRAGWVKSEEDYPWSSAGDSNGELVPVQSLELGYIEAL